MRFGGLVLTSHTLCNHPVNDEDGDDPFDQHHLWPMLNIKLAHLVHHPDEDEDVVGNGDDGDDNIQGVRTEYLRNEYL